MRACEAGLNTQLYSNANRVCHSLPRFVLTIIQVQTVVYFSAYVSIVCFVPLLVPLPCAGEQPVGPHRPSADPASAFCWVGLLAGAAYEQSHRYWDLPVMGEAGGPGAEGDAPDDCVHRPEDGNGRPVPGGVL